MILPIRTNILQPSFGILKEYRKTHYGDYMRGTYKDYNIEIYNVPQHNQKLIYVSDKLLHWIKSKLFYIQDGVKKVSRCQK